jgi:hypothetical protein
MRAVNFFMAFTPDLERLTGPGPWLLMLIDATTVVAKESMHTALNPSY